MILVAGEALIDLIVPTSGAVSAVAGGGPFNTARTIARLGERVAFVGCLSTDRFGTGLRTALAADGVDLTYATSTDEPTTLAIAELDDEGGATYRFHTAATSAPALDAESFRSALDRQPDAIHIGTLGLVLDPMATILASTVDALDDRTVLMVDPNCRPSAIADREAYLHRMDRVLRRADVVKVSADDVRYLDPARGPLEAARALAQRTRSIVLLTDGARPVTVIGSSFEASVPVPAGPVVDTVGSGDAFGGGFLAWWIGQGQDRAALVDETRSLDAVRRAIDVAGITCQRAGADPPTRHEVGWPPD